MECDGLYADRVCKDRGSSARSHKVDDIEVLSFLSRSRGFATRWLFQLCFVGVARNGLGRWSVGRLEGGECIKESG